MENQDKRAADRLVGEIEQRISSGALEHDQPLPAERDLMEEFGISRTVVREAISMLSNRGLLETRPRFRPIVKKPDYNTLITATDTIVRHMLGEEDGIQNLYQSRVFVEVGLVRSAAQSATREDIADLKKALQDNEKAIPNPLEFYASDVSFHRVFYTMTGNPIFPAIHLGFASWLEPQWEKMLRSEERNAVNFAAHKAIYDAVLERDPDQAEDALRAHLSAAWEFVRDTF